MSFIVALAFLAATATGTVLYIVPSGQIAFWTGWRLLALTKEDWGNIHIVFGLVFSIAGSLHLFFNWKPFMSYLRDRQTRGHHIKRGRELATAGGLSSAILLLAIWELPPVGWLYTLGDTVKAAWAVGPEAQPPFGHAEQLALRSFVQRVDIPLDQALAALAAGGIAVAGPEQSLQAIARANRTSPMDVFLAIRHLQPQAAPSRDSVHTAVHTIESVESSFSGTGLGRRTLAEIGQQVGFDAAEASARLAAQGVRIAPDDRLRDAAERQGVEALDLLKAVLVTDYTLPAVRPR